MNNATRMRPTLRIPELYAFTLAISTSLSSILGILFALSVLLNPQERKELSSAFKNLPVRFGIALFFFMLLHAVLQPTGAKTHLGAVMKYDLFLCLPFWIAALEARSDGAQSVLRSFILSACLIAVLGFFKAFAGFPMGPEGAPLSLFKNYIATGVLLSVASLMLLMNPSLISRTQERWGLGLGGALALVVLLLGDSRSAQALMLFFLACWGYHRASWRGLWSMTGLGILLLACAVLFSPRLAGRLMELSHNLQAIAEHRSVPETSTPLRVDFIRSSLWAIQERPMTGFGMGHVRAATEASGIRTTDNPHSEYLLWGIQMGIPGLLALLAWFAVNWHSLGPQEGPWAASARIIVLGWALSCLTNSWISDTTEGHLLFLILALGWLQRRTSRERAC